VRAPHLPVALASPEGQRYLLFSALQST